MRAVGKALAGLMLVAVAAQAQQPANTPGVSPGATTAPVLPPGGATLPAADPVLDKHLLGWEKEMQAATNFYADFDLTMIEATFKREQKYKGSVLCAKPNFARLRKDNASNSLDYEAYICNGRAIYEYRGLEKTITEHKLPPGGGTGDNLMLDFLSGMKAEDAKRRFKITLFKEDQHYIYLDIVPLLARDQQDFRQVRFALFGPNVPAPHRAYLPVQVYLVKPNGDAETWAFKGQKVGVAGVDQKVFEYVPIAGWQVKQAPKQVVPAGGQGAPQFLPGGTNLPSGPGAVRPK